MVKLLSGRFVKKGFGKGRDQFNINEKAIINGNYYGVILNTGQWHNISLEKIDNEANKKTEKIEDVLLIYCQDIEGTTCIVALAENTTVYREMQNDENIIKNRIHSYTTEDGKTGKEKVGYHTITEVKNMHILKDDFIPIQIPPICTQAFRAQRFLSKDERYRNLREQIIEKACNYLYNDEIDLPPDKIENAKIENDRNSSMEKPDPRSFLNGNLINKKPWVSKKALDEAGYVCEFDHEHKTFSTNKVERFMEGHHLIRCTVKISEEIWDKYQRNIDTESNIVSLCPTCHRRIHYGNINEKTEIVERLYMLKQEGLHKNGILISLGDLKEIYGI